MTGLVDRLRSALDEAEEIAQAATSWRVVFGTSKIGERQRLTDFANANDPAHVLRTIQAHRKIIELAEEADTLDSLVEGDRGVGQRDFEAEPWLGDVILAALASIYFPEGTEP